MAQKKALQLAYGVFMLLFLGLIYGWSVFVKPLEAEFSWVRSQTSLVFTFSMSSFCIGGFASGLLLRKFSARVVLRICAVCLLAGFFLASRVSSLWHMYLSYGVICSIGVGFGYNAIIGTVAKWFPEKPGLCSGLLLAGFGLGGMLLGSGAALLIAQFSWRVTFLIFCILFFLVLFLGSMLLRPPSQNEAALLPRREIDTSDEKEYGPRDIIRRASFWLLFLWALLQSALGLSIIGQAVPFAMESGASVAAATAATGMISICNGLSRVLFGKLFDRLGRKKAIFIDSIVLALSVPVLYAASRLNSPALVAAGFLLLGTGYGGIPALVASSTNHMYGVRHYALNYGAIMLHVLPASLIGPIVAGNIRMLYGSYTPLFPILFAFCLPAILLAANMKKQS